MGGPNKVEPTQVDPLRPEYKPLSSDLASYGQTLVGKEATPYTGRFTAPIDGSEADLLGRINRMVAGGDGVSQLPFGGQRGALISDILSGRRLSPGTNPYLDATVSDIARRSNDALGGNLNLIDAAFGRSGMLGPSSGRSTQSIQASRLAGSDVSSQIANLLGANYNNGLNEQLTTLGQILPQIDSYNSSNLFNALSANALPRTIQQSDLSSLYNEFLRQQSAPLQYTQLASQILGSQPGLQAVSPSYAPMPYWQQLLLGGISGGAQGAGAVLAK